MTGDVIKIRSRQSNRINARREWGAHHFFDLQRNFARAMLQAWEVSLLKPPVAWTKDAETGKRTLGRNAYELNMALEWAASDDRSFDLCCEAAGQNARVLRRFAGMVEEYRWTHPKTRFGKEKILAWKQRAARELGLAPPVELWKRQEADSAA